MLRSAIVLALALFSQWAIAAVNLNTATKEELIALPGIGPAKAQAILDYRKANGAFKSVEELKDVKGIGAKRFEKLKPELTVAPAAVRAASASATTPASPKPWAGSTVGPPSPVSTPSLQETPTTSQPPWILPATTICASSSKEVATAIKAHQTRLILS